MRRWKWTSAAALLLALIMGMPGGAAYAKGNAYTYTVTFYAGNQGTYQNSNGLSVSSGQGNVSVSADKITVSGLKLGDIVSFNPQAGALSLNESGKYYIKGVRASGRDNETVSASAFTVDGDADYVAAYGIKGDTVAYTVNYEDTEGKELADSNTYYGNVGDRPVVAYLYIEGYTPQALAQTKTLVKDASKNVFTFVYIANEELVTPTPTPAPTPAPSGTTPTATPTPAPSGTTPDGTTTDAGGTPDAGDAAATPDEGGANTADDVAGEEIQDDDVPLVNQPLVDLDDEENEQVPKVNNILDEEKAKKGLPLALYIGMGTAAGIALAFLAFALKKRKKSAKAIKGNKDESGKQ